MDISELKQRWRRPQWQREGEKSKRFRLAKQQLCACITLFCTFLCRRCTTKTWKCLISRFFDDVNSRRLFTLTSFRSKQLQKKRTLANVQRSWLHFWSKTLIYFLSVFFLPSFFFFLAALSQQRMGFLNMLGVYVVMSCGIVVAFITLIAEIFWKKMKKRETKLSCFKGTRLYLLKSGQPGNLL